MLVVVVVVVVVVPPPDPPVVVVVADDAVVVVVPLVNVKTFDSVVSPSLIIACPVPEKDPAVMFHVTVLASFANSVIVCVAVSLPKDSFTSKVFDLFW